MKTALIIPVYNEGGSLRPILQNTVNHFAPNDTIIVDDGSTDNCTDNLQTEGFKLIRHRKNEGKGAALRSGFSLAAERDYDWALTMDGDGQHDPKFIPDFIGMAEKSEYDLIIGNRRKRTKMPLDRRISNCASSRLLSLVSGYKILDAQCGYRMYKLESLKNMKLKTNSFDLENELLLNAFKKKMRLGWVDISTIYNDEISHIHRWGDTMNFIKLIAAYILGRKN